MKQGDLLLTKIRSHIARRALTGAVLLFTTMMVLNASNLKNLVSAQTTNNLATNLAIIAGSLEILNVPNLPFSPADAGMASTETGKHNNVVIRDHSAGAAAWTLYVNGSNMVGSGSQFINAQNILIYPSTATLLNINAFNTDRVGRPADGANMGVSTRLFNSTSPRPGTFGYANLEFNVTVPGTLSADQYTGTITLTLVDDAP